MPSRIRSIARAPLRIGLRYLQKVLLKGIVFAPPGIDRNWKSNITLFLSRENVEGDYLEFGVYRGDSFIQAYHATANRGLTNMRYYAFDSFKGLPSTEEGTRFSEGDFACTSEEFKNNLQAAEIDLERVTIVEGWYQDILNQRTRDDLGLSRAAWVYVDCDVYESTKLVLDFITPLVDDGTILSFNDWWVFKGRDDRGEQRACREWLKAHPEIKLHQFMAYGYSDMVFVVQRS